MEYNKNKDFDDHATNKTNNVYVNNQEKNSDLPYHLINKPKIPMSYYFPEGNLKQQYPDKESDHSQNYKQHEQSFSQSNFGKTNDEIVADSIPFVILYLYH
jgi:hypothetical protein